MKHEKVDTPSITRNDEKYINDPMKLLRLFSQKSSFQTNPLEVFYQ